MYRNILVAVAPDHPEAAAESLQAADALAAEGAQLTALTIVEPVPDYVTQYLPDRQLDIRDETAKAQLKTLLADRENSRCDVISGHAGRAIVDYAQSHGIDCIIIRSHKPELQDYFLGSTAGRVVRHARCAVHVIR